MRPNYFCYVLLAYTICGATIIDATIIDFLVSTFIGSNEGKCKELNSVPASHASHGTYEIPNQGYLLESPEKYSGNKKLVENVAAVKSDPSLLRRGISVETSKALEGLLRKLQEDIRIYEEAEKQLTVWVPEESSVDLETDRPLMFAPGNSMWNTEMVYKAPYMQELPSIVRYPRKYSYVQEKGDVFESISSDYNLDVKVSETKKSLPRHPDHIESRIQQAILGVPLLYMQSVHSNMAKSQHNSKLLTKDVVYNMDPIEIDRNKIMTSHAFSNIYDNSPVLPLSLNCAKNFINDISHEFPIGNSQLNNCYYYLHVFATRGSNEYLNNELGKTGSQETARRTVLDYESMPNYVYIPPNYWVEELSNNRTLKTDMLTGYVYKQSVNNKEFEYEDSQDIGVNQKGDKLDFSSDYIYTHYNAKPIIVALSNEEFDDNTLTSSPDNILVKKNENLRGDIPEY